MTDILYDLDAHARLSFTTPGEVRTAWREAAHAIAARDGDFDSGRILTWLAEHDMAWATGSESGATITAMVRSKEVVWTGRYAELGNRRTRNSMRPCKVYAFVKAVA